jgi:C4-type Zn-finger protein
MRALVQPPRALHCDFCHGELRLKQSDQDWPFFEFDVNTLVCTKCGHETTYRGSHDRYAATRASNIPPTTGG